MQMMYVSIQCLSKCTSLYSTVSSPQLPWQTCSFQCYLDFSGKHSAMLQLLREDYSFRYPPLSVARYSFKQLSELNRRGVNEIAKAAK